MAQDLMEYIGGLDEKLKHDWEMGAAQMAGVISVVEGAYERAADNPAEAPAILAELEIAKKELVEKVFLPASKDRDMDPTSTYRDRIRKWLKKWSKNEEANRVAGVSQGTPADYE